MASICSSLGVACLSFVGSNRALPKSGTFRSNHKILNRTGRRMALPADAGLKAPSRATALSAA
ncbi:MAG: hypothetical protein KatS3mg123_3246 [Burkholderiales bacterium]|nr:MAG: hypothetical protein KatS3mg123_3246 [Burkholderiales bacterium]